MENIRLPMELIPERVKNPAAFIAEKNPDLPDYGIRTGDLVIIDRDAKFTEGELSVFMTQNKNKPMYRIADKKIRGYNKHIGQVVITIKYAKNIPLNKAADLVRRNAPN